MLWLVLEAASLPKHLCYASNLTSGTLNELSQAEDSVHNDFDASAARNPLTVDWERSYQPPGGWGSDVPASRERKEPSTFARTRLFTHSSRSRPATTSSHFEKALQWTSYEEIWVPIQAEALEVHLRTFLDAYSVDSPFGDDKGFILHAVLERIQVHDGEWRHLTALFDMWAHMAARVTDSVGNCVFEFFLPTSVDDQVPH